MSLVKIQGNASGTGEFTIAAPNSNTNRTLTLPDNTGTFLTSATTTGFPAGSVLQVVQATYGTLTTVASTTYADSGLTASITPTSATSKILIIVQQPCSTVRTGSTDAGVVKLRLLRDSTSVYEISQFVTGFSFNVTTTEVGSSSSLVYLDSPATTSSITYKTQGAGVYSSNTAYLNGTSEGGSNSSITLMEIAA
jgi:hypothetical protein